MSCENTSPDLYIPKLSEPFFGVMHSNMEKVSRMAILNRENPPWLHDWTVGVSENSEQRNVLNIIAMSIPGNPSGISFCPLSFLAQKKNCPKKNGFFCYPNKAFCGGSSRYIFQRKYTCVPSIDLAVWNLQICTNFQRPWNLGGHSAKGGSPNQRVLVLPSKTKYVTIH